MDTAVSVELFVEILNRYVYYFDQQNETVSNVCLFGLHLSKRSTNGTMFDVTGNDKISEWTDRAYPLEFANEPRKLKHRSA